MSRPASDLVLRARTVHTPDGPVAASVVVTDGVVIEVAPFEHPPPSRELIDLAPDEVLLPGLVDCHVHINEPGRTEWEGFASATRAAAAGGVTTLVDMPLNSIPTTVDLTALEVKQRAADGSVHVDVAFWGGAVPDHLGDLEPLHRAGVVGFKCFLLDSGIPEFPPLDPERLAGAMRIIAGFDGLLIAHAEDPGAIAAAVPAAGADYRRFLASRPDAAEEKAVALLLRLAAETGCRVHVVHVSSAATLPLLSAARARGVRVTAETCPHYLTFGADEIGVGATEFKCCPPIRDPQHREALWAALADGTLDLVVSDHSPSTPDLKQRDTGDFGAAWGGIASLQLSLPAVWTGARSRGLGLDRVVSWMAAGPADLVGLPGKGRIEPGASADFCVFAPEAVFTVDASALHHRHPLTPYAGWDLHGVVRSSWLRGRRIDTDNDAAPMGRLLTRGER
ncbi:allantoinase AllB [Nocardioides sp. AN3]